MLVAVKDVRVPGEDRLGVLVTTLRELEIEQAQHEECQPGGSGTSTVDFQQEGRRSPATYDSDQAQANLEKMLETGEENPIS